MTDRLKIFLAQHNPTVGDIDGNAALIRNARATAAAERADLVRSAVARHGRAV
jgi:NAD+ synthase